MVYSSLSCGIVGHQSGCMDELYHLSFRIDPPCNQIEQFLSPKRLGEKIISTACLWRAFARDVGREENHGNVPGLLPPLQLLAQFPSIFALQPDIEQDQVGEVTF